MEKIDINKIGQEHLYQIVIQGSLPKNWKDWLDGFKIVQQDSLKTKLHGSFVDQASLHGLLAKIRDWGLTIILIEKLDSLEE
jgi:hypothetical protein